MCLCASVNTFGGATDKFICVYVDVYYIEFGDNMELAKINVTVSLDAKNVLVKYQDDHGLSNLDSALESLLCGYTRTHGIAEADK